MVKQLQHAMSLWNPGWMLVVITLVIQSASIAYLFGTLNQQVSNNKASIRTLVTSEAALSRIEGQVDVLRQELKDDENLLHSIAKAVGVRK